MQLKKAKYSAHANYWLAARRVTQTVTFLLFFGVFIAIKQWGLRQPLSALPFFLDPLAMVSFNLSGQMWIPLTLVCFLILITALLFGRVWCGWICPMGSLFDIFPSKRKNIGKKTNAQLRKVKHILLIATLTTALLGSLSLLIFDPLVLLFRSLTTVVWPALNQVITFIEQVLYPLSLFKGIVSGFESSVRPFILPLSLEIYRFSLLFAGILLGIFMLNLITERYWCRYLCPLGSGLGLISKIAFFKRQVDTSCTNCGICARNCPTGTIDPDDGFRSDPAECTMCMRCLGDCPKHATVFMADRHPAAWHDYDPGKRDLIRTVTLSAAAVFIFNLHKPHQNNQKHPQQILPPGANHENFYSTCIRCSECVRVCPTGGLQPAFSEAGLAGLWTPILVPRIGHCEYSCNACGQICPTSAIAPLTLPEKRAQIIGGAYIDQSRCIAWGERRACIVCQEVCPLSEKAIILEDGFTLDNQTLKLPRIMAERCIGCGTCENKCPVAGPAAIRVFTSRQTF